MTLADVGQGASDFKSSEVGRVVSGFAMALLAVWCESEVEPAGKGHTCSV